MDGASNRSITTESSSFPAGSVSRRTVSQEMAQSHYIAPPDAPHFSSVHQSAHYFHALAAYNHNTSDATSFNRLYVRDPRTGSPLRDARTFEPITVEKILSTKPLRSDVSTRPGPGNRQLTYMSGESVTRSLNEIFGFDGWSSDIKNTTREECCKDDKGRYKCTYTATVRLTHKKSGVYKEDCGAGDAIDKCMGTAISNSLKASVTDALKRAARHFGEKLGNSLYGNFNIKQAPNTIQQALDLYEREQQKIKPKVEKPNNLQIADKETNLLLQAPNPQITGQEQHLLPDSNAQLKENKNSVQNPNRQEGISFNEYGSGPTITPPIARNENNTNSIPTAQNHRFNSTEKNNQPYSSNTPNQFIKPETLFQNSAELQKRTFLPQQPNQFNNTIHQNSIGQTNCPEETRGCNNAYGNNNSFNENAQPNQHTTQQLPPPPPFQNRPRANYNNENNGMQFRNTSEPKIMNNPLNDVSNLANFDYDLARPGTSHGAMDQSTTMGINSKRPTMQGPASVKKARKNPYSVNKS